MTMSFDWQPDMRLIKQRHHARLQQWAKMASMMTLCNAGDLSICVPMDGMMPPHTLNLTTGELRVLKPGETSPDGVTVFRL